LSASVQHRWVGYFATPVLSKILQLFEHPTIRKHGVEIISLNSTRTARGNGGKPTRHPLPFLKIEDLEIRNVFLNYDYTRYGKLKIAELREALRNNRIQEMAIGSFAVKIQKEWILGKEAVDEEMEKYRSSWERNPYIAAVFKHVYLGENGERRQAVEEHLTEEERGQLRFKRTALDLVALQDARVFLSGGRDTIADVNSNVTLISNVMYNIDYAMSLAHFAEFRMGAENRWILVRTGSIRELRKTS
jgi:hypothetical protein